MAMDAGEIEQLIKEGLPDAAVTIEDLRGDGDHYACHVVSEAFRGNSATSNGLCRVARPHGHPIARPGPANGDAGVMATSEEKRQC